MRIRVIRCEECGWVKASDCEHWSMDCPRAKKKKKAHHKLKRVGEPGYAITVTPPDHEYVAAFWDEESVRGWRWEAVPNDMRYADCECGLPWSFHMPWRQGNQRYLGKYKSDAYGEAVLVPPASSLLIECVTKCGLKGAE